MILKDRNNLKKLLNYFVQIAILIIIIFYFFNQITPIVKAAQYSHPTTDDYWMSSHVHNEWVKTHSFLKTIASAFDYAVIMYKSWDGNFLSMFLTCLTPLVFNEFYYGITFYFMLISMLVGAGMVTYALLYKRWQLPVINCISIFLLFIIFFLNFITDSGEGLYWWPGVANYTFFFGFLLFAQGLYIMYWEKNKKAWLIMASIAFFLVGLGNPITGLINVCLLVYELAFRIFEKKSIKTLYWIPFVCSFIALMLVVLAPGSLNRIPQAQDRMNIFELIFACFRDGTIMLKAIVKPGVRIYFIMVALISFFSFYGKENEKRRFRLPGVYAVLMICLYYAAYAPILYAGGLFYGRLLDTTYFIMLVTFTVSIIYVCGALAGCIKRKKPSNKIDILASMAAVIGVIICISTVQKPYYYLESISYHADFAIKDGSIIRYNDILYDRYQKLIAPDTYEIYTKKPPYIRIFLHDDESCIDIMGDYFRKKVILEE